MKKISILFMCSFLLMGCNTDMMKVTKDTDKPDYSSVLSIDNNENKVITPLSKWVKETDHVVLATIISLDQLEAVTANGIKSGKSITTGMMLIQRTYQGTISKSHNVEFIRSSEGHDVTEQAERDVNLEIGKTYLLTLEEISEDHFQIIDLDQMTRETNIPKMQTVETIRLFHDVKVKNDKTDIYEPIQPILKEMGIITKCGVVD